MQLRSVPCPLEGNDSKAVSHAIVEHSKIRYAVESRRKLAGLSAS